MNPDGADGSAGLLGIQAVGVVATYAWSGVLSFVLIKLVSAVTPLRPDAEDESGGLDLAEGGERAYITADETTGR